MAVIKEVLLARLSFVAVAIFLVEFESNWKKVYWCTVVRVDVSVDFQFQSILHIVSVFRQLPSQDHFLLKVIMLYQ